MLLITSDSAIILLLKRYVPNNFVKTSMKFNTEVLILDRKINKLKIKYYQMGQMQVP